MSTGSKRLKALRATMSGIAELKDGRRAPIYIAKTKDGKVVATVVRNSDQMFRGGHTTLTDARADGLLCWMMDITLLPYMIDLYGITHIITLERDTGDMWVSKIEDWSDDAKLHRLEGAALMKVSYRGLANKYLPVHHMQHLPGKVTVTTGRRGGI